MLNPCLALAAVLLGQSSASSPVDLVARLGAARYAERESASKELEEQGRRALPALRSALDSADAEIRTRAVTLVHKIEGNLLTQATPLTLNFQDQPLAEVIRGLHSQSGIKLTLVPENSKLAQTRITLTETTPLPFWKSIDRLCEVAGLQYQFGAHGYPNGREPFFPLFAGQAPRRGPISDQGPFRIQLISLHYQRDLTFETRRIPSNLPSNRISTANRSLRPSPPPTNGRPPRSGGPDVSEQFFAQVQVLAEPRLSISQNGPLKIREAIDDRGESLVIPSRGGAGESGNFGYFGIPTGSVLQIQAHLRHPQTPGKLIVKLQGTIPLAITTRKLGPLVVPLAGSVGKSFHNEEVNVVVRDIRVNPDSHQTNIDLTIQPSPAVAGFADIAVPRGAPLPVHRIHRPETHQQQIEIIDAQGRNIPWYHSSFDAEGSRFTLTLTPHDQVTPAELHYYGLAKASIEVPFTFSDVPMP
jgi:hypothetical protein